MVLVFGKSGLHSAERQRLCLCRSLVSQSVCPRLLRLFFPASTSATTRRSCAPPVTKAPFTSLHSKTPSWTAAPRKADLWLPDAFPLPPRVLSLHVFSSASAGWLVLGRWALWLVSMWTASGHWPASLCPLSVPASALLERTHPRTSTLSSVSKHVKIHRMYLCWWNQSSWNIYTELLRWTSLKQVTAPPRCCLQAVYDQLAFICLSGGTKLQSH